MKNQLAKLALREAMREPDLTPRMSEMPDMEEDTCTCPRCRHNGPKEDFMLSPEADDASEAPEAEDEY